MEFYLALYLIINYHYPQYLFTAKSDIKLNSLFCCQSRKLYIIICILFVFISSFSFFFNLKKFFLILYTCRCVYFDLTFFNEIWNLLYMFDQFLLLIWRLIFIYIMIAAACWKMKIFCLLKYLTSAAMCTHDSTGLFPPYRFVHMSFEQFIVTHSNVFLVCV